jgi:exodeoxyribonuclease VII small subunit
MAKKDKKADRGTPPLEEQLKRLEQIVSQLESEGISLEKAIELFEEGTAIVRSSQAKLKESQLRVMQILGEQDGEVALGTFQVDEAGDRADEGD